MKLKEVTHIERGEIWEFDISCNRFVFFDKLGRELSCFSLERIENYLELNVLEIQDSSYTSGAYCVGFPTTHIKVDILNDGLCYGGLKFGEAEYDGRE